MPDAKTMAVIDEMTYVAPEWQDTKRWVRSFYAKTFFEDIRHEHGIKHLSEKEFLDLHHDKLVKAAGNDGALAFPIPLISLRSLFPWRNSIRSKIRL